MAGNSNDHIDADNIIPAESPVATMLARVEFLFIVRERNAPSAVMQKGNKNAKIVSEIVVIREYSKIILCYLKNFVNVKNDKKY